jgi:hypothetical protein
MTATLGVKKALAAFGGHRHREPLNARGYGVWNRMQSFETHALVGARGHQRQRVLLGAFALASGKVLIASSHREQAEMAG